MSISHKLLLWLGDGNFDLDSLAAAVKSAFRTNLVRHDCRFAIFTFGQIDFFQMLVRAVLSGRALGFALSRKTHEFRI
jgi:hypothetical protein